MARSQKCFSISRPSAETVRHCFHYRCSNLQPQTLCTSTRQPQPLDSSWTSPITTISWPCLLRLASASRAKKSIDRIPLLGYILAGGEDQHSMILEVKGNLYDPEVTTSTTQDVVTYPLKLIQRTILLPVHVAGQVQESSEKGQPERSEIDH